MEKHYLSFGEKLSAIRVYLGRRTRLWLRFKVSFAFSLIAMFVTIAIFYFMNKFLGNPSVRNYSGNLFAFIFLGLAINQYMQTTLSLYLKVMHETYWSNWLEMIIMSPMRMRTFFAGTMLWTYLYATMYVLLYFIVGIFVFKVSFVFSASSWLTIPILILLIISLSGIGLISASMFLLANAKGEVEPIGWGVSTLSALVAGVYFPPEYLPPAIRIISRAMPQTYALEAIREIMLNGAGIGCIKVQLAFIYLAIFSVILLPAGIYLFNCGIRKAERDGTLARWA